MIPAPDEATRCAANTSDADARQPRDAAAVFVGNALRSLRRIIALRMQQAPPAKALHEARRGRDAMDSVVWALEYEAGLRERGDA